MFSCYGEDNCKRLILNYIQLVRKVVQRIFLLTLRMRYNVVNILGPTKL